MGVKGKRLERQEGKKIKDIRKDHLNRYLWSAVKIKEGDRVLDIACGVGYGSKILAKCSKTKEVIAVDRSKKAINQAKKYFWHKKIKYISKDIFKSDLEGKFDFICSFETLEHLRDDKGFLKKLRQLLNDEGLLLISTPNQEVLPYDKEIFPFHQKHYTSQKFITLLEQNGFSVKECYSQVDAEILKGFGGRFNIAVCVKEKNRAAKVSIRNYLSLLKENCKQDYAKDFVINESFRLVTTEAKQEFLFVVDKFLRFEKVRPLYLKGFFYESKGNLAQAIKYFEQVTKTIPRGINRDFIVSSYYHLAGLYRKKEDKIKALKRCLKLAPNHQGAGKLLKSLV